MIHGIYTGYIFLGGIRVCMSHFLCITPQTNIIQTDKIY